MEDVTNVATAGVYTASLTPMNDDWSIDHRRYAAHVNGLLEQGCNGVVLMGSTGEANSFSIAERMIALDAVLEADIPPEKLIVGVGCCALPDTLSLARHALGNGVHGLLLLPPYYYKNMSDEGLFASIDALVQRLEADTLRITLYHFPKLSGIPYTDGIIHRLLTRYPEVEWSFKDSSGDFDHMKHLVDTYPPLRVMAGSEHFLLNILRIGGVGCISATANVTSSMAAGVYECWNQETGSDTHSVADTLQDTLSRARLRIQEHALIPALKGLMARRTGAVDWGTMRPPNMALPADAIERLHQDLEEFPLNSPA